MVKRPSPWCGKGFFFQSASSAVSIMVSIQSPCANECTNICAHVNNPKRWEPYLYHCLDTRKHPTYLLRLPRLTRVWRPGFPSRDREVLGEKKHSKTGQQPTLPPPPNPAHPPIHTQISVKLKQTSLSKQNKQQKRQGVKPADLHARYGRRHRRTRRTPFRGRRGKKEGQRCRRRGGVRSLPPSSAQLPPSGRASSCLRECWARGLVHRNIQSVLFMSVFIIL